MDIHINIVLLTELSNSLYSHYHLQVWTKARDPLSGNICGISVNGDLSPFLLVSFDMYMVVETMHL